PETISIAGNQYFGPIASIPDPHDCDGMLTVLERQVMEGGSNNTLPILMDDSKWKVGADNSIINSESGMAITGRQDFPDVWEFDGSLIAMDWEGLHTFTKPDFLNHSKAYFLSKRDAMNMALQLKLPIFPKTD
ncbi:MAG: hypothetical protein HQK65_02455, partial [Desulfamplus sp.]|nr:hypothetical protein [Desulfamplus sp.]